MHRFIRNIFTGKGILTTEFSNSEFIVINTHLSANRGGDWSSQSHFSPLHTKQIAEFSQHVNSVKRKDYVFFSGDFNIPKTSDFYKNLVSKTNSIDLFEKYNFPTFHKEFLFKDEKGNRLDFIFLKTLKKYSSTKKQHIFTKQTIQKTVNRGFVSDHMGLIVTISLP